MDSEDIKRLVTGTGAVAVGIAATAPVGLDAESLYLQWIAAGKHGGMSYLEKYQDVRRDPRLLLEGAESIIVAAFNYYNRDNGKLRWARYALGRDYHEEIRERLDAVATAITVTSGAQCRVTVDTAPLRERYWAVRAGLGFIGLNNQLIVPGIGSRVFIGTLLWTETVDPDMPCTDSCARCGACLKACPAQALQPDGSGLDARRCLSYLTIEHRGDLPENLHTGGRLYGCDACQDVCPHNRTATPTAIPEFTPSESILALTEADIDTMDADRFRTLFRHSAVRRTKLEGLRRNLRHL